MWVQCLLKDLEVLPHIEWGRGGGGGGGAVPDEESGGSSSYWNGEKGGGAVPDEESGGLPRIGRLLHTDRAWFAHTTEQHKYKVQICSKNLSKNRVQCVLVYTLDNYHSLPHIHGSVRSYWIRYSSNHASCLPLFLGFPRFFFVLQFAFSIIH